MIDRLEIGEALFIEGKVDEAENVFNAMMTEDPLNPDVLNNLGIIQESRGDLNSAAAFFRKAISADETYVNGMANLANIYERTMRWKEAAQVLESLVRLQEKDPGVLNRLAVAWVNLGEVTKAVSVLNASLELAPDQAPVFDILNQLSQVDDSLNEKESGDRYKAAFTEINITPEVSVETPVLLQGMAGAPRNAGSVDRPLTMQLLLLEDRHHTKILIVSADLFGFDDEMVQSIRTQLAPWGIAPEGIVLNASHTHYAPGTMGRISAALGHCYKDYALELASVISNQVQSLYASLEDARLSYGRTKARIGVNRRKKMNGKVEFGPNHTGFYERHTPFFLVEMEQTGKRVFAVSHGCHPTGMGHENAVSPDFPGYMRDALITGGFADGVMYLQGCAGDIKEAAAPPDGGRFCERVEDVRKNGELLASKVIERLQNPLHAVSGPFFCTRQSTLLPLKEAPSADRLEQVLRNKDIDPLIRDWGERYLPKLKAADYPKSHPLEVQWVSIGNRLHLIAFPAEPMAEMSASIRARTSAPESTFVLGYTNGLNAYLPTDGMIDEGGYEVESSHLVYQTPAPLDTGTEAALLGAVDQCIDRFDEPATANGYGRHHLTRNEKKAFFVLSAGRCGTMTLAHVLNTAENAIVWHHPQPDLIRESLQAYWGNLDKRAAFRKARSSIIHHAWDQGKIHGETDLLMTFFCDMLAEEIEDSKFIILTRHPADFVRSGMRRNYYQGHFWDHGRLRPAEGTAQYDQWQAIDQFDKICWLWRETYHRSLQLKDSIGEERVKVVRFEDLIRSGDEIERIFTFLDLEPCDIERISPLLEQKMNAQKSGRFPTYDQWSQGMKHKLWDCCQTVAAHFDYQPDRPSISASASGHRPPLSPDRSDECKRITFITGMHGSGAASLAQALNHRGLNLPLPDTAHKGDNENGLRQDNDLMLAGRRLLGLKHRWFDTAVIDDTDEVMDGMRNALLKYHLIHDAWGWQDPLTMITFDHWKCLIPPDTRLDLVIAIRNPHDVARALRERHGYPIEKGLRLCEIYNSHALKYIEKGYPVQLFNDDAADKEGELNRICSHLNLTTNGSAGDIPIDEPSASSAHRHGVHRSIDQRLTAVWREQVGENAVGRKVALSEIRPALPLAILMVNGKHNYKDRLWVEKAIGNVIRRTSVYTDYRIFLWNHDHENKVLLDYLSELAPHVEVLDETTFDVPSFKSPKYDFEADNMLNYHGFHVHRTPLQILYEHAVANYAVDTFFAMDTDAWPVRANWDVHLLNMLGNGAKLTGVWRDEMASAIKPFVHASGLGIKAETILEAGLRFDRKPDGPHEDTLSHFTREIQQRYGDKAVHPLKRSNRKQYHAVYGGVYGDLFYHHHQGTIYRGGRQEGLMFKGSADRGERAEENKLVCDALTEMVFYSPDDYIHELIYGDGYDQLKIMFYLLKNRNTHERFLHMLELASANIEQQPLHSYFILQLIVKHFAYHPAVLNMMATLCFRMRLDAEARCYQKLALSVEQTQRSSTPSHDFLN